MSDIAFSAVISVTGTSNQIGSTGGLYPVITIANNPILPGSGSVGLPEGNTAARSGPAGAIRFNTQTVEFEGTPDGSTWHTFLTAGGTVNSVSGTSNRITASPTTGNVVVDIAATYVGQTSITTLGTIATGVWNATTIGTIYGGTGLTSYILGDLIYGSAANVLSKLAGNTTSGIQYLAQTGTGVVSAAPAWTTISGGDITGAALTKTDDTNVTLTLTGTPNTALLRAANIAAGWSGTLSLARGGTAASLTADNGGIVYSTASTLAILASTATAGKVLQSGSSAAPAWSTPTYPSASGTAGKILRSDGTNNVYSTSTFADTYTASNLLYSNGANTVTGLATANSASLVTNSSGVPAWSSTLTDGQLIIGSTGATPVAASLTAGSGVTITPGAGTITIAATGSGGTVTSVSGTANQINSTGGATPVISIVSNAIMPGSGGLTLPSGNTAARAGGAGTIRFNSQASVFETTSDGATWDTIETSGVGVISVSGTTNRITATPNTGLVVVDISASYVGQTSITTLGTIGTGTWQGSVVALAYGGTNANLTASNGGIFYSTASAGAILSGTATALQMLQSGASGAPAWSTTTWPATTTANRILYSSATSVIGQITSANSAVLVTDSSGVPGFSGTMTNGQLIIGSTGATPTAATLTAGSNITITNAAGGITIAAAAGAAGAWTKISTGTASSSASIAFTGLSNSYIQYMVVMTNIIPASNAVSLYVQFGTGGTPTYQTSAYYDAQYGRTSGGSVITTNHANAAQALINADSAGSTLSTGAGAGLDGVFYISNPSQSSINHQAYWQAEYQGSGTESTSLNGGFEWRGTTAVTAVQFYMSSGNIASGIFTLYGLSP